MVHVGEPPPLFDDVLGLLTDGDIVTHCFNGKAGGSILEDEDLYRLAEQAAERGIVLDVGHGGASFSFDVAKAALARGLPPKTISTDLHNRSIDGSVWDMATTMSKLLSLGMKMEDVVTASTTAPRRADWPGRRRIAGEGQAGRVHAVRCRRRRRDGEGFAGRDQHACTACSSRATQSSAPSRSSRIVTCRRARGRRAACLSSLWVGLMTHQLGGRHHPVRAGPEDVVRQQAVHRQGGGWRDLRPEAAARRWPWSANPAPASR